MNGVVGQVRVGDVALCAMNGEGRIQRAAATVFDQITEVTGAGGFSHHAPVDFFAAGGEGVHHFDRTVAGRPFLIRGNEKANAPLMVRI